VGGRQKTSQSQKGPGHPPKKVIDWEKGGRGARKKVNEEKMAKGRVITP